MEWLHTPKSRERSPSNVNSLAYPISVSSSPILTSWTMSASTHVFATTDTNNRKSSLSSHPMVNQMIFFSSSSISHYTIAMQNSPDVIHITSRIPSSSLILHPNTFHPLISRRKLQTDELPSQGTTPATHLRQAPDHFQHERRKSQCYGWL